MKSEKLEIDSDIFHTKKYGKREKSGEYFQVTPRKRKPQRSLGNIDQFLDNVDTANISKLIYEKTDIYLKKENEEEKLQVTPRKRKPQRTQKKY